jgi:hypothetical protein
MFTNKNIFKVALSGAGLYTTYPILLTLAPVIQTILIGLPYIYMTCTAVSILENAINLLIPEHKKKSLVSEVRKLIESF